MQQERKNIKVGHITFFRTNYGAFLQAYALQQIVISFGLDTELINYDKNKKNTIVGVPIKDIKTPVIFLRKLAIEVARYGKHKKRKKVFMDSINRLLSLGKKCYTDYSQLCVEPLEYDVLLIGSDQLLNPMIDPESLRFRLGEFTTMKKVSYAVSAGNSEKMLSQDYFLNLLKQFSAISVREERLKEYLEKECGLQAYHHIDPTLILPKEKWDEIAKKPEYLPNDYILYYHVQNQSSVSDYAEMMSRTLSMPVFCADRERKFSNQIKRKECLSPEEWIGAIRDAQYVVTNSFHGLVFSMIFHKKVLMVLPPKDERRIVELLALCNAERLLDPSMITEEEREQIYTEVDKVLLAESQKSIEYLKETLMGE